MAAKYCILFFVLCAAQINAELSFEETRAKATELCGTFVSKVEAIKTTIASKSQEAKDLANKTLVDGLSKLTYETDNQCAQLIQTATQQSIANIILKELSCVTGEVEKAEKSIESVVTSVEGVCIKFNKSVAEWDAGNFFEKLANIGSIASAGVNVITTATAESLKLSGQISTITTSIPACAATRAAEFTATFAAAVVNTAVKCATA